jgi:hypothetical protein
VADVARGSTGSTVDVPVRDDPAADARADLDQEQVLRLAPVHPVLAPRHDVDVVVDQHGRRKAAVEPLRDREVVPARHDRRVDRVAALELDGPRHPDPDPAYVAVRPADLAQQLGEPLVHPLERPFGPERDVEVGRMLRQRRAGQIARGQPGVSRTEIRHEHEARIAVEREYGRRPSTGRDTASRVSHEPVREQRVDPLRHRGACEPCHPREVGSRHRHLLPDQMEQRSGTRSGGDVLGRHSFQSTPRVGRSDETFA